MKNLEKWMARDRAKVATDAKASSDDPSSMAEGELIDELKEGALTFDCVPIEMRTPQVCLAAVQQNGYAIRFLTEAQRSPEVCLAAVRHDGRAIEHLTEAQRTPEICLAAVSGWGDAIRFLTEAQRSPEVCLAAVQQFGDAIQHLTEAQRSPEVCLTAVSRWGPAIQHLTEAQRTPEICLAAVKEWGFAIQYLTDAQPSPEVCLAAVQQDTAVMRDLSAADCAQPLISDWIEANWKDVVKLLGRDKAREVAQAILDARQADAEGAQAGYERPKG